MSRANCTYKPRPLFKMAPDDTKGIQVCFYVLIIINPAIRI